MAERNDNTTVAVDRETHDGLNELAAMATIAAKKKITVKKLLSDLVKQEKERQNQGDEK